MLPSPAHTPSQGSGKIERTGRGMRDGTKRGSAYKGASAIHPAGTLDPGPLHLEVMGYAPAQPAYWPPETMYHLANVQQLIIHQVHYYFSTENLCKDEFLRLHMDSEGWLPIQLLATFNRLRHLTTDIVILTEALKLSPELEVQDGHVRKRHDWQRWVFPASPSPEKTADANAEQWKHQMSDASAASSAGSSPPPQEASQSHWRDVASKQLPIPAASKDSAAARVRASTAFHVADVPHSTSAAASTPAELSSDSIGPIANEAAHHSISAPTQSPVTASHQPDSEQRLPASVANEDIGWETSKGKSRRRSKSCQQAAAPLSTQPNQYSLTQLKSGPPMEGHMLDNGRWDAIMSNSNSDEANSDETIPLNEDDWSSMSAGSVEEQSGSAESSKVAALRVSTSSRRKRATTKATTTPPRATDKPGAEKLQTRSPKESSANHEEPMHAMRGRPAKREQLGSNPPGAASTSKQYFNSSLSCRFWKDAARVAPKAQQFLKLPATHLAMQSLLVALAMVLLCVMPQCMLPPTLPQLEAFNWLEITVGIALAFKLHDFSGTVQSICAPSPASSR